MTIEEKMWFEIKEDGEIIKATMKDEQIIEVPDTEKKDYKEIISAKNVYYYNAIIKELQKDKSYDRIVIGEDLEPFSSDDYSTIDKFLFDKLDKISDEQFDVTMKINMYFFLVQVTYVYH